MPTHRADTRLSRRPVTAAPAISSSALSSPRRAMQAALAAEAAAARRARRRARLPQLVSAGALAVAVTVAVPTVTVPDVGQSLLGRGQPATAVAAIGVPAAVDSAPVDSGTAPAFRVVPAREAAETAPTAAPPALAPPLLPRPEQLERASRSRERSALAGCAGVVTDPAAPNGQLSDADLCTLWVTEHRLRPDAAVAAAELNRSYRMAFGTDLCVSDSYRSLQAQQSVAVRKPHLAALPGTSEHGWGLAIDLCDGVQEDSTPQYAWMMENAGAFGWANPEWAQHGGSGPFEPWHWEYTPPVG